MDANFWQGKRVFLTGHTGFKGSWLSLWLQSAGAELVGYALAPPTDPSLFEVARVADGMTSVIGDITDYTHLHQVMADFRPEIVLHLAAQSVVSTSYLDPVANYQANVMGTVYVLEAIRQVGGVRSVVSVTSDKCYENNEWLWGYRETEALGGYDPYSSSKACAELVTAAYRNSCQTWRGDRYGPGGERDRGRGLDSGWVGGRYGACPAPKANNPNPQSQGDSTVATCVGCAKWLHAVGGEFVYPWPGLYRGVEFWPL
jgi:nucleoside-diphosphate-sugar epimerase